MRDSPLCHPTVARLAWPCEGDNGTLRTNTGLRRNWLEIIMFSDQNGRLRLAFLVYKIQHVSDKPQVVTSEGSDRDKFE